MLTRADLAPHVQLILTDGGASGGWSRGILGRRLWRFAHLNTRRGFLLADFGSCFMPADFIRAPCEGPSCGWHREGRCVGGRIATGKVAVATAGLRPWPRPRGSTHPRTFACPRAGGCVWQREVPGGLCAPWRALAHGLDPRACI